MKSLQVSEDIVPLGEFKSQASRVLRKLHATRRAVVITQNGRPSAVLVTPEEFDRLTARERFVASVNAGLADSESGRVVAHEDLKREFEAEFGVGEDR